MQEFIQNINSKYSVQMSETPKEEIGFISLINTETFTEEEKKRLQFTNELDSSFKPIETKAYRDNLVVESKQDKKEAINKVASISDQLNLIASVLDTITSKTPDQAIINNAKDKFNEIKNILNT